MAHRLRRWKRRIAVAYVPEQALSGAAIAALGCDEIVMAPAAVIGDAGPIFQGEDALFRHAPEKIRSHLAQELPGFPGREPKVGPLLLGGKRWSIA